MSALFADTICVHTKFQRITPSVVLWINFKLCSFTLFLQTTAVNGAKLAVDP